MTHLKVQADKKNIDETIARIEEDVRNRKIDNRNLNSFLLYSEELLLQLIDSSDKEDNIIHIRISGKKKHIKAQFSCTGRELSLTDNIIAKDLIDKADFDEEQTIALSKMIIRANSDRINVRYKRGLNIAQLNSVEKSQRSASLLAWMFCGLLFGFALKMIGNASISGTFSDIFSMASTMFMNAVKMLVTPLVFFSIADSVTGFSDISSFGKIGGKVVGAFVGFSVVALFIAFGVFSFLKPGNPEIKQDLLNFLQNSESTVTVVNSTSLSDTITDIVPSGFVSAFVKQNMLQIIFLAILTGFISGKLGHYSEKVQSFLIVGKTLFAKLMEIVVATLKPVCFCMLANSALTISKSSFFQQLVFAVCIISSHIALTSFYVVFIGIVCKLNPFKFLDKLGKSILIAISTMSGTTALPTSMRCCDDMGIAPKVYSFSLPFGTSVGKSSSCMLLLIMYMFIARIMDIIQTPTSLFALGCTILLLILGSPGIPGASLACLTIILTQAGIPSAAVGYIMGIYTLLDGFNTAANVISVATATLVVAKSENLLDTDKYNS